MLYNAILIFPPDNPIYKGHFPHHPITPGVCQIEQIKQECMKILRHDVMFDSIQECKFIKPIIPDFNCQYNCNIEIIELNHNYWKIKSTIDNKNITYLKLTAHLKAIYD